MPAFTQSLRSWQSSGFSRSLKSEIEGLPAGALPLAKGTRQGGRVDDSEISATIISCSDRGDCIEARVGVFFNELVGGCSCGDEPFVANTYCELRVAIDKASAEATFAVIEA